MNPAVYYLSSIESFPDYVPTEVDIPNGQIWDQYNLNTARYNDGTPIPKIASSGIWPFLTTGAYRFYNNNPANAALYGRLYNWYAVNGIYDAASLADPNLRKDIAPEGWRVATLDDWQTLSTHYGGNTVSGGPLKETGTTYWLTPNTGATNTDGFGARGGGYAAGTNSTFLNINSVGYWWPFNATSDRQAIMQYNTATLGLTSTQGTPTRGYSVRLIKKDIIIPGFTTTLSSYDANSIGTGGDIPITYTENISERGIVWGTSPNPNIIGQVANKIPNGDGTGVYSITIPGLSPATQYYIRAYAIIATGTAYAAQQSVVTQSALATITTNSITSIEASSAVGGGNITYINSEYTVITSGLVWSTLINPTVALTTKTTDGPTGTTTGSFSSTMTGLSPITHYYVRAYATTSFGTAYGANVEFDTVAGTALLYAYSLRRVVPGYNGPAIRVRNGSLAGSPQFDVGFAAGTDNLDTVALLLAMGSTNTGYVTTFYDQNGSGKNMITTVPNREPKIVDTGKVLITKAGPNGTIRPATRWGLNFSSMQIPGVSIQVANMSIFLVCSNNTSTLSQRGIVMNGYIYPRVVAGTSDNFFYNGANRISMGATSSDTKIYSNLSTATQAFAWKNNSLVGSYTGNGSGVTTTVVIGVNAAFGNELFNGTIQEMLFYTGDLAPTGSSSRSSITTNAMTYYGII